jgi:hypothetical protein
MISRKLTKALIIRNRPQNAPLPEAVVEPEPVAVEPEAVVVVEPEAVVVVEPEVAVAVEPEVAVAVEPEAVVLSVEELLSKPVPSIYPELEKGIWDAKLEELISWEGEHKNRKGLKSWLQERKARLEGATS